MPLHWPEAGSLKNHGSPGVTPIRSSPRCLICCAVDCACASASTPKTSSAAHSAYVKRPSLAMKTFMSVPFRVGVLPIASVMLALPAIAVTRCRPKPSCRSLPCAGSEVTWRHRCVARRDTGTSGPAPLCQPRTHRPRDRRPCPRIVPASGGGSSSSDGQEFQCRFKESLGLGGRSSDESGVGRD